MLIKYKNNGLLILSIAWIACVLCGKEEISSKYIMSDGIQVLREDYENFVNSQENELKKNDRRNRDLKNELFEREYELQQQEEQEYSEKLPKRCHGKFR